MPQSLSIDAYSCHPSHPLFVDCRQSLPTASAQTWSYHTHQTHHQHQQPHPHPFYQAHAAISLSNTVQSPSIVAYSYHPSPPSFAHYIQNRPTLFAQTWSCHTHLHRHHPPPPPHLAYYSDAPSNNPQFPLIDVDSYHPLPPVLVHCRQILPIVCFPMRLMR